jgi:phage tail protein X
VGLFGELFEDLGLSDLLTDGKWITIKNGKRLKISYEGKILAGMPTRYHGTNIRDLSKLSHEERALEGIDCEDLRMHCHTCRKTFRSKDEAVSALLQANPQLDDLRQSEFGSYDLEFLKWQRGGRRGAKPRTTITDGRLDAINEYYDLRGAGRVASFTEAIYHAVPASKKWADLEPRLVPLEEATGIKIHLPDEALRLSVAKLDLEQCRADVDQRLADLFERAKAGRLEGKAAAGDVPF